MFFLNTIGDTVTQINCTTIGINSTRRFRTFIRQQVNTARSVDVFTSLFLNPEPSFKVDYIMGPGTFTDDFTVDYITGWTQNGDDFEKREKRSRIQGRTSGNNIARIIQNHLRFNVVTRRYDDTVIRNNSERRTSNLAIWNNNRTACSHVYSLHCLDIAILWLADV